MKARNGRQTAAGFYHGAMKRALFCLAMLVGLAAPATAQVAKSAEVQSIQAGVVCPPESVGYREAPGTITGRAYVIDETPDFVAETHIVPAVIGVGFGVMLHGVPELSTEVVTVILRHPPMGPNGVTRQEYSSAISGAAPTFSFFQFDYPYELVQGRWSFEARKGDQLLYRAFFQVVAPQEVPALADICNFRDLLS